MKKVIRTKIWDTIPIYLKRNSEKEERKKQEKKECWIWPQKPNPIRLSILSFHFPIFHSMRASLDQIWQFQPLASVGFPPPPPIGRLVYSLTFTNLAGPSSCFSLCFNSSWGCFLSMSHQQLLAHFLPVVPSIAQLRELLVRKVRFSILNLKFNA